MDKVDVNAVYDGLIAALAARGETVTRAVGGNGAVYGIRFADGTAVSVYIDETRHQTAVTIGPRARAGRRHVLRKTGWDFAAMAQSAIYSAEEMRQEMRAMRRSGDAQRRAAAINDRLGIGWPGLRASERRGEVILDGEVRGEEEKLVALLERALVLGLTVKQTKESGT